MDHIKHNNLKEHQPNVNELDSPHMLVLVSRTAETMDKGLLGVCRHPWTGRRIVIRLDGA